MLFQPFVENAFKHGVSATAPSTITIQLRQPAAPTIELCVRNTVSPGYDDWNTPTSQAASG